MQKTDSIYIAGHTGLVGSAIVRRMRSLGYTNILTPSRSFLDLTSQQEVYDFFKASRPKYVFLAAAKVGGIGANKQYPADFIRINLKIQTNVIECADLIGAKLMFFGSSCIYPRDASQPIAERALLTGPLEPTNEAYAIAKIAGIKMVQAYKKQYGMRAVCVMPTNLYGPGDNFNLHTSHVIPALIRKFHEAKEAAREKVYVWGSGTPRREFLHVDDLASACVFLMQRYDGPLVNIGSGSDVTISQLALLIKHVVGFEGAVAFDATKPDGTPRKLLNSTRLVNLGWEPKITLREGLASTYQWYKENKC